MAWAICVPLLVALLPLAVPAEGRRVAGYAAGGVLLAMCFVSVGVFFLVPAILLLVAAHAAPSRGGAYPGSFVNRCRVTGPG